MTAQEAAEWKKTGWGSTEVETLHQGFPEMTAQKAAEWKKTGWGSTEVVRLHQGCPEMTAQEAAEWRQAGWGVGEVTILHTGQRSSEFVHLRKFPRECTKIIPDDGILKAMAESMTEHYSTMKFVLKRAKSAGLEQHHVYQELQEKQKAAEDNEMSIFEKDFLAKASRIKASMPLNCRYLLASIPEYDNDQIAVFRMAKIVLKSLG